MNLNMEDLEHIHKVLTSDAAECKIHGTRHTGGRFKAKMAKRILDDQRVLARIERIIGRKPEYE